MKPRHLAHVAGGALILLGLSGLLTHAAETNPAGWALWFGGTAIAHDLILAPLVLVVAMTTTWVPARYRAPLQSILVTIGCVVLIALPLLAFSRIRQ
ncbi:hypothetical protein ACRYCC_15140 [Actinomadura scrupuli]|uniref:hypothetical protein n=1 Tax=Actinomadura scrupuli TaxID=559629 RepID=UPI003D9870B5